MNSFSEKLEILPGITAIIGSGGKTTLMYRLAEELREKGSVIVTTTTHIRKPDHLPFLERADFVESLICMGTPWQDGKLTAPAQEMKALAALADYVLVEADGSKGLPLKAHAPHEPVIPDQAKQVICVIGASGLNRPAFETVHRPEVFISLTGNEIATPQNMAKVLKIEHFHTKVVVNQADMNEAAARELAGYLDCPVFLSSLQKGEIICL